MDVFSLKVFGIFCIELFKDVPISGNEISRAYQQFDQFATNIFLTTTNIWKEEFRNRRTGFGVCFPDSPEYGYSY